MWQRGLRPNQRVIITGTRIRAVGDVGAVKLPKGADVVDAQGKYLIPGLWDVHVHPYPHPQHHAADLFCPLFIAYGITGIRDAGIGDAARSTPAVAAARDRGGRDT